MKKIIIILILLLAGGALCFLIPQFLYKQGSWVCENGQWVKYGNPKEEKPVQPCGMIAEEKNFEDLIQVYNPQPNDTILSPLIVEGKARGYWFFEGDFPIQLIDDKGNIITNTFAQTKSDWMTENFVPFEATISFPGFFEKTKQGKLILIKDNPSGLPEHDARIEIPVIIQSATTTVKVFFNNSKLDPEFSCNKVFSVEREVAKIQAIARLALEELLKGPTEQEKTDGFITNINSGVKIQKLTIENGQALVDFNEQLEYQVGGSCRVAAIRAQITETLKQFPSVNNVIISINGRTEDILQP